MQYLTVTDRAGTPIRISLGALQSWEPSMGGGVPGGSVIRYGGQTITVRESPEKIDEKVGQLLKGA